MRAFANLGDEVTLDVELVVGKPLVFDADTDAAVATARLEEAVAAL